MTVKADWGCSAVAEPASPAFDPMSLRTSAAVTPPGTAMKPIDAEKPLDLTTPIPELRSWLTELVRREGNLFNCGTTCPLRDKLEGNCTACPVSQAGRKDGTLDEMRLSSLCKVGAEQERTSMLLLAKREHGV